MLALPPDPYQILGIDRSIDKPGIRSAYLKLVLLCHPDKVTDPVLKSQKQDEFQRVQQAYELLYDDAERARYENLYKMHQVKKEQAASSRTVPSGFNPRSSPRYEANTRIYDAHCRSPNFSGVRISTTRNVWSGADDIRAKYRDVYAEEELLSRPADYDKFHKYKETSKRDDKRREKVRDRVDKEVRAGESKHPDPKEKKRAEKERKREADEKRGRNKSYVLESHDLDSETTSRAERKQFIRSKTFDDSRLFEKVVPRMERDPVAADFQDFEATRIRAAREYMGRPDKEPALSRSQTYNEGDYSTSKKSSINIPHTPDKIETDFRRQRHSRVSSNLRASPEKLPHLSGVKGDGGSGRVDDSASAHIPSLYTSDSPLRGGRWPYRAKSSQDPSRSVPTSTRSYSYTSGLGKDSQQFGSHTEEYFRNDDSPDFTQRRHRSSSKVKRAQPSRSEGSYYPGAAKVRYSERDQGVDPTTPYHRPIRTSRHCEPNIAEWPDPNIPLQYQSVKISPHFNSDPQRCNINYESRPVPCR